MGTVEKIKLGKEIEGRGVYCSQWRGDLSKGNERQEPVNIRGKSVPSRRVARATALGLSFHSM